MWEQAFAGDRSRCTRIDRELEVDAAGFEIQRDEHAEARCWRRCDGILLGTRSGLSRESSSVLLDAQNLECAQPVGEVVTRAGEKGFASDLDG